MNPVVSLFLKHFGNGTGRFIISNPDETPYEKMIREYEAQVPSALETMKLVLAPEKSPEDELAFWRKCAADERAALRNVVEVEHRLNPVESENSVEMLAKLTGGTAVELIELYQHIGSAELYVDKKDPHGGILFYSVSQMAEELENVRDWLRAMLNK